MNKSHKVIVIGGGAAGLTCAYLCARAGADVTVLEKNLVTGKKLSMTGNGRANLTNEVMNEACFNPEARETARSLLERYGTGRVISFFREIGVLTRSEDGYIYPVSGEADGVARALELAALRAGVRIDTSVQAKRIESLSSNEGFRVHVLYLSRSNQEKAPKAIDGDIVVLASGGLAGPASCMATGDGYYMAELMGIPVTPRSPALTGLKSKEARLNSKNGIRMHAGVSLYQGNERIAAETGEVQITNEIISGIPVMQCSRWVKPLLDRKQTVTLQLNLFPEVTDAAFNDLVGERIHGREFPNTHLSEWLLGFSPSEMNALIVERMHLSLETDILKIEEETLRNLLYLYRNLTFRIEGVCDYKRAQVTAGGIRTDALTKNMESVQTPGLFCIGEVLDADGRCGGYNLQWAFMTAMAAAARITG